MGTEGKQGGGVQFYLLFEIPGMTVSLPFASVCLVSDVHCIHNDNLTYH
jgi:hypothetical protein